MWVDRGLFWEHTAPQGTDGWKEARKGRINSSNSGAMAEKSRFKSAEETGKIIAGVEEDSFSPEAIERMAHGTREEPTVRNWYEKEYKCQVLERGLCVSKDNYRIGASVDGEVIGSDVILEIKCPVKMYGPLVTYMENVDHGWKPPVGYHDHIWENHFLQVQHGMHILQKKYCDYVVYCSSSSRVFTQRIAFDPEYWQDHYSLLKTNYDKYIYPYVKDTVYPLIPNCF